MDAKSKDTGTTAHELIITRTFDAPRDLVWKAYSEPERVAQWWGPKGFTFQTAKMDFRSGGVFHYGMKSPEGHAMWGKLLYKEVIPQEKIVAIVCFSDENGGVGRHPMAANWPLETLSVLTLAEKNGKTTLTLKWSAYNATEEERKAFDSNHASMNQGMNSTWDALSEYLQKTQS